MADTQTKVTHLSFTQVIYLIMLAGVILMDKSFTLFQWAIPIAMDLTIKFFLAFPAAWKAASDKAKAQVVAKNPPVEKEPQVMISRDVGIHS